MTARKPLWTQAGSTSAEEDRALVTALYGPVGGVVQSTDLAVTQNGTPNMSVNVAPGRCVVVGTENATMQGDYVGWLDAILNVVISASDPTNGRIDLIVAKFQDAQYSGATNAFSVVAVTGVASGSPVAPAAPANSIILAQISVAATSTTVLTAAITDKRGPIVPVPSVGLPATYPAAPLRGSEIYRISNDVNEGPELYDGTAWRKPWNMPWGIVTPSISTAASGTATAGGAVEIMDAVLGNYAFTAVAGRRYRVIYAGVILNASVAGDQPTVSIRDGGAGAPTIASTLIATRPVVCAAIGTAGRQNGDISFTTTFTAGTHTLGASTIRFAGTGVETPVGQRELYVEDIGPAGAPS